MKNSKLLLTSLLAAAAMSVSAFADTRTTQNVTTWNIKYVNGRPTYTEGESVFKWVGGESGNAETSTNWVSGTYSSTDGLSFTETNVNPARVDEVGFLLYFDGRDQTITVNGTSSGQPDSSDGGGVWVTGTGNVVTVSMGRWAGSIQVDAGNVLNTSWSEQLKDGQIVAYGTVNISGKNLNFDTGRGGVMSDSRQWFVGSEGVINFTTSQTDAISNADIVLSGEVDISAAEITGLVNRSMSILLREKQLVTFSAGLSSGLDRLSLGTISSIDGASATESTALTSVDSKEALTASTYYAEKTDSGVKIYYLGNGYAQETLTWAGTSADHVWVNEGSNWTKDGTATSFLDNDNVVFGTDAESKTVSVASAVSVGSAAVNDDYEFVFSNNGSVSADSVTVEDTKTLTLAGTGTFASKSWSGALSIASGAAISVGTSDFVSGTASVSFADASGKITATGTNNSSSGFTDLTGVFGAGTIEFAAVGSTDASTNDGAYSWVKLSDQFTGTLSITSGIVDMLAEQGENTNKSSIDTVRLGGTTLIELNGGGLLFRNVDNTTLDEKGTNDKGTFDKAIEVGANGGVIRVYGAGNVTLAGNISGTGTLTHTDGGTLKFSGDVDIGGFNQVGGTASVSYPANTEFSGGSVRIGTLNVSGASATFSGASTTITSVNVTGGTVNFTGTATLGTMVISGGALNISGGTVSVTALNISGGTVSVTALNISGSTTTISEGALNISSSTTTISGGTTTTANGTTVGNGAELVLGASGATSHLQGVLTINSGGTVKLTGGDATGYGNAEGTDATNVIYKLVINKGGVLEIGTDATKNNENQTFNMKDGVVLLGGQITAKNGVSNAKFDLFNTNTTTVGVKTLASDTTAVISADIGLRNKGSFDVASGTTTDGVDLLVSGRLTNYSAVTTGNPFTKELTKSGAGTMKLTGDNQYWTSGGRVTEGTLIAASTTALGKGGTISVSKGATLGFVAGTTVDMLKTTTTNDVTTTTNGAIQLTSGAKVVVDMLGQDANQEKIVLDLVSGVALSYGGVDVTADNVDTLLNPVISLKNWGDGWTQSLSYADSTLRLTLTIPEPSVFGLLAGLGALALAGTRRRRRKA